MIQIVFMLTSDKILCAGHRLAGPRQGLFLEQQAHEHEHRFGFDDERPRRLCFTCIEMLMNAVGMNDRNLARLPVMPDAVVYLLSGTIKNIERRFIHMAVLL